MNNTSVVPHPPVSYTGKTVNGRFITGFTRDGRYWKWHWLCPVHPNRVTKPMRIKDMVARNGPRCCYKVSGSSNPNWRGHEDMPMKYYNQVRVGAATRGHVFDLTPEDMWNQWVKQGGVCKYSGHYLKLGDNASLDRIDSRIGYTVNNIQWLHKDVNLAKQGLDEEDFLSMCCRIADNVRPSC